MRRISEFGFFSILGASVAIGALALVAYVSRPAPAAVKAERRCGGKRCNVIFIAIDTLAAGHMGLYGYDRDTTPFLDQFFGTDGIVFDQTWSTASWTHPSFASMFTSQYPSDINTEIYGDYLSPQIPTVMDALDAGGIAKVEFTVEQKMSGWGITEHFRPNERLGSQDPLQFLAGAEWIRQRAASNQPFFAFFHSNIPHTPYDPPEPYRRYFGAPDVYPGAVTQQNMDWNVGREKGTYVQAEVDRYRRQYDEDVRYTDEVLKNFFASMPPSVMQNSIIILTADHGEAFNEHGAVSHGNSLYEEEVHVPLAIRFPGYAPRRISTPVSLLDLAPTILDMYGLARPATFRGTSLVPLLDMPKAPAMYGVLRTELRPFVPETTDGGPSLVRTQPLKRPQAAAMRIGNWKLYRSLEGDIELYNLAQDPAERMNRLQQPGALGAEDKTQASVLFRMFGLPVPPAFLP